MSHQITFAIDGLHCGGCVARAEKALAAVPGVRAAQVNLATAQATIHSAEPIAATTLAKAADNAGYPAGRSHAEIEISAPAALTALHEAPGVLHVEKGSNGTMAQVEFLRDATSAATLSTLLREVGIDNTARATDTETSQADELSKLRRDALLAVILTFPVFVLEMGSHVIPGFHAWITSTIGQQTSWWIQAVLTTLVLAGPGRRFFTIGLPALLRGAPEMNTLVALGTIAAWGFSLLVLLAPTVLPESSRAAYFEAAAVIATLILLGRYIEARARTRTSAAIEALIGLQPKTAQVYRDGQWIDLTIGEVLPGDRLRARPGERLAADGTVIAGESFVDESMITGEARPVAKAGGAQIIGGTINGSGALEYEATTVGEASVLAQIVRMVKDAQGNKLPVQALVDQIAGVFVPVVLGIAALTVALWLAFGPEPTLTRALVAGVSVLIVACPCAMGLATPTSIMAGTGRAAELGVLFRRGDALQQLHQARVVAFDKTGTLTMGQPAVTEQHWIDGADPASLLPLIAAVEAQSEHPVARAIADLQNHKTLPEVTGFAATAGKGVSAKVDGREMQIGSARFLAETGIDLSPIEPAMQRFTERGASPVAVAIDGTATAAFAIADPIKPTAAAAVSALRSAGLHVALITGDAKATAQAVAKEIGIGDVIAEVLPGEKQDRIRGLQNLHGATVFVGDGINDAPALAQADTGVAIGTGTDIAMETADVVLMRGDPAGVLTALSISRATMRNIRQNLFWAFAYNVALIPVAAGLFYPLTGATLSPMLAAGAMALSSVFVISNALRLGRFSPSV